MRIKNINWMNKEAKEAIVNVCVRDKEIMCFSCPCNYNIGDKILLNLECLNINNIFLSEEDKYGIYKLDNYFKYRLCGRIMDKKEGIIEVYNFKLHIEQELIPGDIDNDMFIEFEVARIDIWQKE